MKKSLVALVALTVFLASCGGDPVKFNDTIIDGLSEVDNKIDRIDDFIYDSDYDNATAVLDSLQLHVANCMDVFSKLEYKSGEEFKAKSLELLKLVEAEYVPSYKKAIAEYKVADEIEDEDEQQSRYDEIYNGLLSMYNKYNDLDDELINIQKVFAKENNMVLVD